jgi:hypothetical protein
MAFLAPSSKPKTSTPFKDSGCSQEESSQVDVARKNSSKKPRPSDSNTSPEGTTKAKLKPNQQLEIQRMGDCEAATPALMMGDDRSRNQFPHDR